jgi:hypothetical protein
VNRRDDFDYVPAEVHGLIRYKPWWYAIAGALILLSALAVAGLVAARDTGGWLVWITNVFQAAQVTLSLFLVVLTYNLFAAASRVTEQNERIHRISQLPIVVAEIKPLSFDPYPSYEIRMLNEGSGPALDVQLTLDYRLRMPASSPPLGRPEAIASDARLRVGVLNKSSHTGMLLVDARGIMLTKPWKELDTQRSGTPTRSETDALLAPYDLVVHIAYKDIYSQEGHTTYESSHAAGEEGIELTELVAPAVITGSEVKPIALRRESSGTSPHIQPVP